MPTTNAQPKPSTALAIYQQKQRIKDLKNQLLRQEWALNTLLSAIQPDSRMAEKIVVGDTVFLVTATNPRYGASSCEVARIGTVSELKDLIPA